MLLKEFLRFYFFESPLSFETAKHLRKLYPLSAAMTWLN